MSFLQEGVHTLCCYSSICSALSKTKCTDICFVASTKLRLVECIPSRLDNIRLFYYARDVFCMRTVFLLVWVPFPDAFSVCFAPASFDLARWRGRGLLNDILL